MALKAKISAVTYTVNVVNDAGQTQVIDLSKQGRFQITALYYDSATPNNILHTQNFEFPQTVTVEEAQARIIEEAQKIRNARVRVAELQVYVGAEIPIP